MIETCKSCGTIFEIDNKVLSKKIKWFKCSICSERWIAQSYFDGSSINNEKNTNDNIISKENDFDTKSEKLRFELASIKSAVEDKTKNLKSKKNPVLKQKNKSVAEIASELSMSQMNESKNNKVKNIKNSKNSKTEIKISILPVFAILISLLLVSAIFFRSVLISYSFYYFPKHTNNYFKKINLILNKVELPILAETTKLALTNFVATVQDEEVKFSGDIQNNFNRPVLVPRIQILVIREDRKIILDKILTLNEKIIPSSSQINFKKVVKLNIQTKKENVSVKASFLKKIVDF